MITPVQSSFTETFTTDYPCQTARDEGSRTIL